MVKHEFIHSKVAALLELLNEESTKLLRSKSNGSKEHINTFNASIKEIDKLKKKIEWWQIKSPENALCIGKQIGENKFALWGNKLMKHLSIRELVPPPTPPIPSQSGFDKINNEASGNRRKEEAPGIRWKEEIEFIYNSVNKTDPPKPLTDTDQKATSQAIQAETKTLQSKQSYILGI